MTKRERITIKAKEILASCPEGIRFSELVKRLRESFPGEPEGNLTGNTYNLHVRFPDDVYKPARGLFRLTRFREHGARQVGQAPGIAHKQTGGEQTMTSLSEALETVRARIAKAKQKDEKISEADTENTMISPVLQGLGWDVGNLEEVRRQYKDTDYALFVEHDKNPIMLVEAKRLGERLDEQQFGKQVMGYVGALGAGWAVLTNGDEYRIYNATSGAINIKERLFRAVRLTDPTSSAEKALGLLSRERIRDLQGIWEDEWADRRVLAAILTLFSPVPHSRLVSFVKKTVKGMTPRQITASLSRVCTQLSFPESTSPPEPKPDGTKEGEYREFWEPIRTERNGLFAGKPAGGAWVSKGFRGICLSLVVHNHACCVDLVFQKEGRAQRREKAVKLLPALKDNYKFHDTPKVALVRFPVLDKGLKDREHWPEIREKLKLLGKNIYEALSELDV